MLQERLEAKCDDNILLANRLQATTDVLKRFEEFKQRFYQKEAETKELRGTILAYELPLRAAKEADRVIAGRHLWLRHYLEVPLMPPHLSKLSSYIMNLFIYISVNNCNVADMSLLPGLSSLNQSRLFLIERFKRTQSVRYFDNELLRRQFFVDLKYYLERCPGKKDPLMNIAVKNRVMALERDAARHMITHLTADEGFSSSIFQGM
ncbi:hypothetical protein VKT23_009041 [Stygiomarasmius scandens]|uniref:Uncharacterized protein n=1 Tax=Marasmiellus scandens TaxID=2682957 RepID=A0ABR1JIL6_9AGAR